jgi:hypothetical protein
MKRLICLLPLLFTLFAGCHLSHPLTQAQVLTFISEAEFGVAAGCAAEWLEPPVCAVGHRVLNDARVAAENAPSGWQQAAKAVLVDEEARLSPDSKLRPYFDAVISLL